LAAPRWRIFEARAAGLRELAVPTRHGAPVAEAAAMRASLLLVLLLAAGCIIEETDDGNDDPDDGVPGATLAPILPVSGGCVDGPSLSFSSASIVDRFVTVIAEHGGGCGEHEYRVCWDGLYGISDPTTVALTVQHRTSDTCEARVRQPLVIDLAELRRDSDDGQLLEIVFPGGASVLYP
jgi:hypothetical protein